MIYDEEHYNQVLAVARSYRNDVERLEKQLANKNDKCEALYSALYTILEEQDPENVASQIEQITKQNFDKENENFKEKRNVMQLLKIVQDQKQQLEITETALKLACDVLRDINYKAFNDADVNFEAMFEKQAKEMMENEKRR